jgi:hypothetical protein
LLGGVEQPATLKIAAAHSDVSGTDEELRSNSRSKFNDFSMSANNGLSRQVAEKIGGASRDRTDDLIVANDALSQLSYSPETVAIAFKF